jgi:hypothetical protein
MTDLHPSIRAFVLALGLALPTRAADGPPPIPAPIPGSLVPSPLGNLVPITRFNDCLEFVEKGVGPSLPDWVSHSVLLTYESRKPRYDGEGNPLLQEDGEQACSPRTLTGRVFFPPAWRIRGRRSLPLVVYNHATMLRKASVPSAFGGHEWALGAAGALWYGYAVVMPDYPGMGGDAADYHAFCHAKSLAYSTIDCIPAARELFSTDPYLQRNGFRWDGRVFLMGYSEGGYATMAAVRELERRPEHYQRELGFSLEGSACMAGPFDISGLTRADIINPVRPYAQSFFLGYVARAYNTIYGDLLPPQEAFASRLLQTREDGDILQWTNGEMDGLEVNERIGKRMGTPSDKVVLRDMLDPQWVIRELDDPNYRDSRLHKVMAENDLHHGWAPSKPILFCHSPHDQEIPYQNTINTISYLGAEMVRAGRNPKRLLVLRPLGDRGELVTHMEAAALAIPEAFDWFYRGMPGDQP